MSLTINKVRLYVNYKSGANLRYFSEIQLLISLKYKKLFRCDVFFSLSLCPN